MPSRARSRPSPICATCPSPSSAAPFIASTACRYLRFLLHYRIDRAREFLAEPLASVSQVAYEVGFNDLSYFGRVFRRIVGVPASHFQQRLQAQAVAAVPACAESFQSSAGQR